MYIDDKKIIAAGYPESEHVDRDIRPTFSWALINICNYKCNYCSAGYGRDIARPKSNFFRNKNTSNVWKTVVTKLKLIRNCAWNVSLLGGEPTLHPELSNIISSLIEIDNCAEVCLITNMHKPIEYFVELYTGNVSDKCWVNPSIHFQYNQATTISKIIELKKTSLKVEPTVVLSDDERHWDDMLRFLDQCIENDIIYNSAMIEDAHGYVPNYTSKFYDKFASYMQHGRSLGDEMYSVVTDDGSRCDVTVEDIFRNNIKKFKGWSCTPKSWHIREDGSMVNSCTKQPLKLGGSNIACKVVCPAEVCNCNEFWMYEKSKLE